MNQTLAAALLVLTIGVSASQGQPSDPDSALNRRYFVGGSLFMLGNLFPAPPHFYQLNLGYRLTEKDVVSVEAITWRYKAPLGIPYGPSYESPEEAYPGHVREYGVGLAYQRYLWKGLYSAAHAVPFLQEYRDEQDKKIQNGFQLFLTFRVGYHVPLFKGRLFVEPSVAATHWPISTNVPDAFAAQNRKWPNYFLFEPGLHFGVRF